MRAVVVGGGAMGSATAWWLARRGTDVTLLEQFEQGHSRGSSHGAVRIFRLAYADDLYVRLALEAEPLWAELSAFADQPLLERTGALDHGHPVRIEAVARALERAGVGHERLGPEQVAERWPAVRVDGPAVFHPAGGRVFADRTVRAAQDAAAAHGAEVAFDEPARRIHLRDGGAVVETDARELRADVVVVAAGSWAAPLLGDLVPLPRLRVTVEQPGWFTPRDPAAPWPSFIHYQEAGGSPTAFGAYGMGEPGIDGGREVWPAGSAVKVGEESVRTEVDPADGPFGVREDALARLVAYVEAWLPGLDPVPLRADTCLFTSTPDNDFVLDRRGPVVVASPCSGHGFKFVPLIGRMAADLAMGTAQAEPRFRLS